MGRTILISAAVLAITATPALADAPSKTLPKAWSHTSSASAASGTYQHLAGGVEHYGHSAHSADRLYGYSAPVIVHSASSHQVSHHGHHQAHGAVTHGVTHHGLQDICGGAYGACTPVPQGIVTEVEQEVVIHQAVSQDEFISLSGDFFLGSGGVGYYEDLGVYGGGGFISTGSSGGGVLGTAGRRQLIFSSMNQSGGGGKVVRSQGGKGCMSGGCHMSGKGNAVKIGYHGRNTGGHYRVSGGYRGGKGGMMKGGGKH